MTLNVLLLNDIVDLDSGLPYLSQLYGELDLEARCFKKGTDQIYLLSDFKEDSGLDFLGYAYVNNSRGLDELKVELKDGVNLENKEYFSLFSQILDSSPSLKKFKVNAEKIKKKDLNLILSELGYQFKSNGEEYYVQKHNFLSRNIDAYKEYLSSLKELPTLRNFEIAQLLSSFSSGILMGSVLSPIWGALGMAGLAGEVRSLQQPVQIASNLAVSGEIGSELDKAKKRGDYSRIMKINNRAALMWGLLGGTYVLAENILNKPPVSENHILGLFCGIYALTAVGITLSDFNSKRAIREYFLKERKNKNKDIYTIQSVGNVFNQISYIAPFIASWYFLSDDFDKSTLGAVIGTTGVVSSKLYCNLIGRKRNALKAYPKQNLFYNGKGERRNFCGGFFIDYESGSEKAEWVNGRNSSLIYLEKEKPLLVKSPHKIELVHRKLRKDLLKAGDGFLALPRGTITEKVDDKTYKISLK